jgi:nitroreductase
MGETWTVDVFEAVRTVLAVRRYQERPVPDEVVHRIVEAARLTASSQNGQPWHFVVVKNRDTLRRLGATARSRPYTAGAALAIAVAVEKASRFAVSDASRAIQSMILTAWEAGVGSSWVGFGGMHEAGSILGVPDYLEVFAIVPFGYPVEDRSRGMKNRKAVTEVASLERFGHPFE